MIKRTREIEIFSLSFLDIISCAFGAIILILLVIKKGDSIPEQNLDFNNEEGSEEKRNSPLPHPKHYADWFDFFDNIDLRVYLRDVEIVLIESALKRSKGTVSKASELLKINRTTLIEKMKKLQINN